MKSDQLSALMDRFSLRAGVFYNGVLCGVVNFGEGERQHGYIHLLRRGRLRLRLADGSAVEVVAPSLMYCPRVLVHRFEVADDEEVELTCATLRVDSGMINPVTQAIPDVVILGTAELPQAGSLLDLLFAEAVAQQEGQVAVINRLFELVIIQILRYLITHGKTANGLLAGLADPRIALALAAIHAHPEAAWSIETMADSAGMSRARFAEHFRNVVQLTPLDYLTDWRLMLAQQMLVAGRPMKLIAGDVGYDSASALARAFRRKLACAPLDWLKRQNQPQL